MNKKSPHTPEMSGSGQRGICVKCSLPPTPEGHDGCLGTLKGDIMNACCGHGEERMAYIQYWPIQAGEEPQRISGSLARREQVRLIGGQYEQH